MNERSRDAILLLLLAALIATVAIVQHQDAPKLWHATVTERCQEDEVITPIDFPVLFECTHIDEFLSREFVRANVITVDGIGQR